MATGSKIDISEKDGKLLFSLLDRYLPGVAVWAYGSRVSGAARTSSDLDLAVFAPAEKKRQFYDLREALEESNLPFQVDLFRWDDIPEDFRVRIQEQYVVVQEARTRNGSHL